MRVTGSLERTKAEATAAWEGGPPVGPVTRPRRAGRGTGRRVRPTARPKRRLGWPSLGREGPPAARACTAQAVMAQAVTAPPVQPPSRYRLTERGVAVVLVTGLLLVTAALTVVGLTALRVTGDHYRPYGTSQIVGP